MRFVLGYLLIGEVVTDYLAWKGISNPTSLPQAVASVTLWPINVAMVVHATLTDEDE